MTLTNDPADHLTRRRLLASAGAGAIGLGLAACGSSRGTPTTRGASRASAGVFPARVAHKFGTTTVAAAPARVAAYGGGDVDTLLALGVVPVLVPDIEPTWKAHGGVGPWARSRLGDARPQRASIDELEFERVAGVRPDLVTAVEYDLGRGDYDKLTALAPTVAPPRGYAAYTVPWDVMAVQVASAVGRRAQGRALVARRRAELAAARAANPSFTGKKVVLIDPDDAGGVYIFAPDDVRTRFLGDLGLTLPASIEKLFKGKFYAQISAERLDLLDDADALVLVGVRKAPTRSLLGSRAYQALRNVREKRVVEIETIDLANAMSYSSVLSQPYQLREMVPRLTRVLTA